MIKTREQIDALAQLTDKEIRGLRTKLTGINVDDSYIHITNSGDVTVFLQQNLLDGGIARHSFNVLDGVVSNYQKEAVYE